MLSHHNARTITKNGRTLALLASLAFLGLPGSSKASATELRFGPSPASEFLIEIGVGNYSSGEAGTPEEETVERDGGSDRRIVGRSSDDDGTTVLLTDSDLKKEQWEAGLVFQDLSRRGVISLRTSLGLTLDPSTYLMTLDAGYFVTPSWSLGPLFQLGLSDDDFLLAASVNFRKVYDIEIREHGEEDDDNQLNRLKPFYQFGAGVLFIDEDNPGLADDDDAGLLLNLGVGVDLYLNDRVSFGTSVLFNFLPSEVGDEHFFLSWQIGTLAFHF